MFDRVDDLVKEYLALEAQFADTALPSARKRYAELVRRHRWVGDALRVGVASGKGKGCRGRLRAACTRHSAVVLIDAVACGIDDPEVIGNTRIEGDSRRAAATCTNGPASQK